MQKTDKIYIAGHKGLVGSAIHRALTNQGFSNIVFRDHQQMNLSEQLKVQNFFSQEKPDYVFLAAAKVGGIHANNTYPAEFIYDNLMVASNVIDAAYQNGVKRLLFLGSSCIYPRDVSQPMSEQSLMQGSLEPTNEPYAIAKIAGIKLCESYNRQYGCDFRSVMPTNLYGPGDNFHPENSHVIPALIRRIHEAKLNHDKQVEVWGSGKAMREFLYVDDLAAACLHIMSLTHEQYQSVTSIMLSHINIGTGIDCSIKDLAENIKKVVNYPGEVVFTPSKPDGTPRKLLDISILQQLGWQAETTLTEGLEKTYQWYLSTDDIRRN